MREIRFYYPWKPYGAFSNFSKHGFTKDNTFYETVEHYFQSKKFEGTEYEQMVIDSLTPMHAAKIGRNKSFPLRKDWEEVKEKVMFDALLAKFKEHKDLQKLLQETEDATLIEDSEKDYYWGIGKDGTGKNRLGHLLMEVREYLKTERGWK